MASKFRGLFNHLFTKPGIINESRTYISRSESSDFTPEFGPIEAIKSTNKCKCCEIEYVLNQWDFHDLCDACFYQFNNDEGIRRMKLQLIELDFNHSDIFVISDVCTHRRK